jgi:hypothetical protein
LPLTTGSDGPAEVISSPKAVVEICGILERFPEEIRLRIFKACEILLNACLSHGEGEKRS